MREFGGDLQDAGDDLRPEWTTEIGRRIEAVERGESHLIPGDEVEARVLETLGRISLDVSKQAEIDGAWRDEILRRMKQVRAGEVEFETWDDARRFGHEALAQR